MESEVIMKLCFVLLQMSGVRRKRNRRARSPESSEGSNDSDSDIDIVNQMVYYGEEVEAPEGYEGDFDCEVQAFKRTIKEKKLVKDSARLWAGLSNYAEKLYPDDYAVMTSKNGPLIPAFRSLPIGERDRKQWLFSELLRLQKICLPPKDGERWFQIK